MKQVELKNKVVLITGSSIGIGRATAFLFAKEGCRIVLTYHTDKKEAAAAAQQCTALGAADVLLLQLDVTDNSSIEQAVKTIVKKFKKIDILINNAGMIWWKQLRKQTTKEIETQCRVNLEGVIKMTRACLPHITTMIFNLASGAGKTAYADLTTYCATKFGVRGFTQALAQEIKIPVYAVNPDMTKTRMTDFQGRPPEEVAQVILNAAQGRYKLRSGDDIDVWERI